MSHSHFLGSALRDWANGNFANGTKNPEGGPSLYGANFQAITWAQSDGGCLNSNGSLPNRTLQDALSSTDRRLGIFLKGLQGAGRLDSTLLLLGSKQGQGPVDPKTLNIFDQSKVVNGAVVPFAFFTGDDGGIMWLERSSDAETAKKNLLSNSSLGIPYVLAGDEVQKAGYGSPYLDSRVPDLVISAKVGTLWAHSFRFEDHGGFLPQDLNVPVLAYNPKIGLRARMKPLATARLLRPCCRRWVCRWRSWMVTEMRERRVCQHCLQMGNEW